MTTVIVVHHTGPSDVPRRERDCRLRRVRRWRNSRTSTASGPCGRPFRPCPSTLSFRFFTDTSSSTGKPKGVVHVHGRYVAGVAYSMRGAFDARPGDVVYVVADPGWITGQSELISAALTTRVTSVLAEGAPVFPRAGRFASIIERDGVTSFKAGVTFLKAVRSDPQNVEDVRSNDLSSLRVSTFCAEPVSPAV